MGRNFGRIGGAVAGIIAIAFGVLDLIDKTPPPWILIALGVIAVVGVLADYFWEQRGGEATAPKVKQKQRGGKKSRNYQAGHTLNVSVEGKPKSEE